MKKRLFIYFIVNTNCKKNHSFFLSSIGKHFDDTISIEQGDGSNSINFLQFIQDFSQLSEGYEKIYIANDNISAPLVSLDELFDYFEQDTKLHSLWSHEDIIDDVRPEDIFYGADPDKNIPLFFCVDRMSEEFELIKSILLRSQTISDLFYPLLSLIKEESYSEQYKKRTEIHSDYFIPFGLSAYDYLKTGFPFFYFGIFKTYRNCFITYGTDRHPRLIFKYFKNNREIQNCLLEFFSSECDASFLKDILQLNIILTASEERQPQIKFSDCAVFVHLYYESKFKTYLSCLSKIASDCDIYISVNSKEKKRKVTDMADKPLRSRLKIVISQNRGRDLSALLIAFKPYIQKYEYFCFIHDKSSHSQEAETVGEAFSDCIWDNLLGISAIVPKIRSFFKENPEIGLLVPPAPYWGIYRHVKANLWTICFERTKQLATDLGLEVYITDEINPVALGTAFWCRGAALLPLFERQWKYEDFDEEPMATDGTLSHSLERVLPYVALHQRYLTAWLMTDEYAGGIFESHLYLLDNKLRLESLAPIPYVVGKIGDWIEVKGALHILRESFSFFFKCFGKAIKRFKHNS